MIALVFLGVTPTSADATPRGWEHVANDQGVRVSRKTIPGSSMVAFRGVMVANVPISRIIAVFADSRMRRKWVDRWDADRLLERRGPMELVYWIRFDLPFPVSDRDYVLHAKAAAQPKKRVFTARLHSVRHKRAPPRSDAVRGIVERTYYRFEALPGQARTKLTVEVHTDPRGMLPAWLVNLIQKKWPAKTLLGLVKVARQPSTRPHPAYLDWHTPYRAPPPTPAPSPAPTLKAPAPKAATPNASAKTPSPVSPR